MVSYWVNKDSELGAHTRIEGSWKDDLCWFSCFL